MTGEGGGEVSNTVSGGIQYGPVLQGGQFINTTFVTQHAAAAPVALAQLPRPVAGFTGRDEELAQVTALLNPAGAAGPVVVSAVAGLAGVGKTALAIQAAHAAREAGWFAGGMLFIDLHGYDETPVQPGQALDALLRALGIPGQHFPLGDEERCALWRSELANIREPVLIIADNAIAEAQVRPLLPGSGLHKVLVTSRHTLAGLGARLMDITVMGDEAGVALLVKALRVARPNDRRISNDPGAAGRVVRLCGGLPLALRIIAALLIADPDLAVSELADELSDEIHRLEVLEYDDGSGASALSVKAAFELSYRQLSQATARLFRLLPVNPGPDVSTATAAVLLGVPINKTRKLISQLVRAHLVEAAAGAAGRWRMHDLLHLYARQLSEAHAKRDSRDQARKRMLDYYQRTTAAAAVCLEVVEGQRLPAEFRSRDDALEWLDEERPNLIPAVALAASIRQYQVAMTLPVDVSEYLSRRRRFDDMLTVIPVGRDAARRLGNRTVEGAALTNLGVALANLRRFEEAIDAMRAAVAIFREIGHRRSEGVALVNLGNPLKGSRRFEEAIDAERAAVAIFREIGDRTGEGMALNGLGTSLSKLGRFEEAISSVVQAVAILREVGDRYHEGQSLLNLGTELDEMGRFEEAISAYQDASAAFREVRDRDGEGRALTGIGLGFAHLDRFEEAISAHQDAGAIFREIDDRHGEGMALNNLGLALQAVHRFKEAISSHEDAAAIFRETGDWHDETTALNNLEQDRAAAQAEGLTKHKRRWWPRRHRPAGS